MSGKFKNQNIVAVDYGELNANTLSYYSTYVNVPYSNKCIYNSLSYESENLGLEKELGRILYDPNLILLYLKK